MVSIVRTALTLSAFCWFLSCQAPAGNVDSEATTSRSERSVPRIKVVETEPMKIDKIYRSMTGPYDLVEVDTSDLDWVTAIRTEVIDEENGEPMSGEFFCHSQLQLAAGLRLTVNATGTEEIRFPPGFGIPISRILAEIPPHARPVRFLGMLLNNYSTTIDRSAKIRATIEYMRDEDLGSSPPLRKLYPYHVAMYVEDLAEYESPPGGQKIHEDVTTHCALIGGRKNHWLVPPGPQRTRKGYKGIGPMEATVHHIATHVHNHGEYVRLTDITTGEILWQADVEYEPGRRQITKIPVYSSAEGFPIYPGHEYEIEAFYDNTTNTNVDAMAVMYLSFNPKGDQELFLSGPGQ